MLLFFTFATSTSNLPTPFPETSVFSKEQAGDMLTGTFNSNETTWEPSVLNPEGLGTISKDPNWECFGLTADGEDENGNPTPSKMKTNPFYVTKDNKIIYTVNFLAPNLTVQGEEGGRRFFPNSRCITFHKLIFRTATVCS